MAYGEKASSCDPLMGSLLVLVCPSLRENVIVTFKIVSFCTVKIIFFWKCTYFPFWKLNLKMALIWKKNPAIFNLLFTFFSHQRKDTKINSFSTYLTHIHTRILLTLLTFLPSHFANQFTWPKFENKQTKTNKQTNKQTKQNKKQKQKQKTKTLPP